MTQTPAGWQPDPQNPGQLRYWDGTQWTEHRAPASQPPAAPQTGTPLTPNPKPPTSGSRRNLWLALGGVALLVGGCAIGAAAAGGGDDGISSADATSTVTVTAEPEQGAAATVTATVTADAAPSDEPAAEEPADDSADDEPAADDGTQPSLTFPKQNGDWRLDSLQVKDDGLGSFGAVGRITYTGGDDSGGDNIFTVTLFNNEGEIVASLTGSASDVKPGQTVTTQFIGFDEYKAGKFPSTFQNDL